MELCEGRAAALRSKQPQAMPRFDNPMYEKYADIISKLSFANGRDMAAAMDESRVLGARLVCADLPQATTMTGLKDAVAGIGPMGLFGRLARAPSPPPALARLGTRLQSEMAGGGVSKVLDGLVEEFKDRETLRGFREWLSAVSPEVIDVMLTRRDDNMFGFLGDLAKPLLPASSGATSDASKGQHGTKAVAVVGIAHMDGLERRWKDAHGESAVVSINSAL